jgi:hypothetical protein
MVREVFRTPTDGTPALDPWVVIERMDGGPTLVVENADAFAYAFFATDPSSIGVSGFDNLAGRASPTGSPSTRSLALTRPCERVPGIAPGTG